MTSSAALLGTDGCSNAEPVLEEDTGLYLHVVWKLGDTLLGPHQHAEQAGTEPADKLRPGLDHVAFGCADRAALEKWASRLGERPV